MFASSWGCAAEGAACSWVNTNVHADILHLLPPRIRSYWWFVVIFEIVSIIGLIVAVAINSLRSQRASWMGVFAVTSLLYISMTEAFLTAENTGTWANTSDVALPKGALHLLCM